MNVSTSEYLIWTRAVSHDGSPQCCHEMGRTDNPDRQFIMENTQREERRPNWKELDYPDNTRSVKFLPYPSLGMPRVVDCSVATIIDFDLVLLTFLTFFSMGRGSCCAEMYVGNLFRAVTLLNPMR